MSIISDTGERTTKKDSQKRITLKTDQWGEGGREREREGREREGGRGERERERGERERERQRERETEREREREWHLAQRIESVPKRALRSQIGSV